MSKGKVHRPFTKRMALRGKRAAKAMTARRLELRHAANRGFWARMTDDQRADWLIATARAAGR